MKKERHRERKSRPAWLQIIQPEAARFSSRARHTQLPLKQWENCRVRAKDEDQTKPVAGVFFYCFSAKRTLGKYLIRRFRSQGHRYGSECHRSRMCAEITCPLYRADSQGSKYDPLSENKCKEKNFWLVNCSQNKLSAKNDMKTLNFQIFKSLYLTILNFCSQFLYNAKSVRMWCNDWCQKQSRSQLVFQRLDEQFVLGKEGIPCNAVPTPNSCHLSAG